MEILMLVTGLIFGYLVLSGQLVDQVPVRRTGIPWYAILWFLAFIILFAVLSLLEQSALVYFIMWLAVILAFIATLIRLLQVIRLRKGGS